MQKNRLIWKSGITLAVCMVLCLPSVAQITGLSDQPERYIDRPLTLHSSNMEFSFGYQFGVLSSIYDNKSNSVSIADAGIASSSQAANIQFTYGVTENWQVQAFVNYSYINTSTAMVAQSTGNTVMQTEGIEKISGMFDPELRMAYLLIGSDKKLSLSVGGGLTLPVSAHKPDKPEIKYFAGSLDEYRFVYNYRNGAGSMAYNLNMALKYRFGGTSDNNHSSKLIARLFTDFYTTPGKVSTNDWQYVFDAENPNDFTYQELPVKYKKGDWLVNRLYFDYQAYTIASFMFGISNRLYFHGWKQTADLKVSEYDVSETAFSVGAHIQASPRLRIDESFTLPVMGKSIRTFFTCQLSLVYLIQ
ncbi:MAG TPA: hypothetical protein PK252_11420 [Bacteroidales bacterium]|nr:hypothetical protein [Bacteroidales bacterium]